MGSVHPGGSSSLPRSCEAIVRLAATELERRSVRVAESQSCDAKARYFRLEIGTYSRLVAPV